jgi:hypothetical protein
MALTAFFTIATASSLLAAVAASATQPMEIAATKAATAKLVREME